jgi:hypothetical protein
MKQQKTLSFLFPRTLILVVVFSASHPLWGSSEKQYLASLHDASDKVFAKKQKSSLTHALSIPLNQQLLGRAYRVGDRWRVLSWIYRHAILRRIGQPETEESQFSTGGLFEYEVREIKSGFNPEITLSITQIPHPAFPPIDSKVNQLFIVLNDQLIEQKKFYALAQHHDFLSVPVPGIGLSLSPLGLYPLDLPDSQNAERFLNPDLPQLPPLLQEWAKRFSWKMNLKLTTRFEQEDFFGRPIQFLWEKGQPWPACIKTPRGISILVESGATHAPL